MSNVKVVIGANFGDEGKGLMTDYFCAEAISRNESCIVALCNGGAQRGHTVVTPDGIRHVFHHFGSGTLVGADTYLSREYILNPMTFRKEYEGLQAMGFTPKVYVHPLCMWSSPYDMIVNQILEDSRGDKRHGSCGMGIWETILRYETLGFHETLSDFNDIGLEFKVEHLKRKRDTYFRKRILDVNDDIWLEWRDIFYSDTLIDNFIKDVEFMCKHIMLAHESMLKEYDNVIFENGQGLLLGQNQTKYGDNTTPSNTGIQNPHEVIKSIMPNTNVEVCYVTRTYMTRHGAGDFSSECDKAEINSSMEDKTNVPNPCQGSIRYGFLDANELVERINADMSSIGDNSYKVSLAVTHINEFENNELLNLNGFDAKYLSYKENREVICIERTANDDQKRSYQCT